VTSMSTPTWSKSRRCDTNTCVEVALIGDEVAVRNSQDPSKTVTFTMDEWRAFVGGVQDGDFRYFDSTRSR
jgi:hypothetical protein